MRSFLKDVRHGRFLLIGGDFISSELDRLGEWSETEVDLFRSLLSPESNIIEVGANIGAHTVPLANLCRKGTVVAFEVQRPIFYVLGANLALNDCMNVIAKNTAAWDRAELLEIESSSYDEAWNYGNFSVTRGFSDENVFQGRCSVDHVEAIRLDDDPHVAALSSVGLLKIDAEGAELRVLGGAKRTIERHRPAILIEANRSGVTAEIKTVLEAAGYIGHWFITVRGRPDSYFGPADYSDGLSGRMEENAIFIHCNAPLQPRGLRLVGADVIPPADLPVLHRYPLHTGEPPLFVFGSPRR